MTDARVIPLDASERRAASDGRMAIPGRQADESLANKGTDVESAADDGWRSLDRAAARALAFTRRRLSGAYAVDDFGFDRELTDAVLMAPFRPLYSNWFRVETRGLENIPDSGGALVVANHSGTLPLDAIMTCVALHDHHPARRPLRPLGAD